MQGWRQAVCNSAWSGEKLPSSGSGDLAGDTPDQPVLISLELVSGPQIPTKSYFTANLQSPYLSGQLIKKKKKVVVPQLCLQIYT